MDYFLPKYIYMPTIDLNWTVCQRHSDKPMYRARIYPSDKYSISFLIHPTAKKYKLTIYAEYGNLGNKTTPQIFSTVREAKIYASVVSERYYHHESLNRVALLEQQLKKFNILTNKI